MSSGDLGLGPPASYLVARPGLPVFASDGVPVGTLEHVVADDAVDIFEGIVLRTHGGPDSHRFVDRDEVGEFYARGLVLRIPADGVDSLHRPMADPSAQGESVPEHMHTRLRRAWDLLSGR